MTDDDEFVVLAKVLFEDVAEEEEVQVPDTNVAVTSVHVRHSYFLVFFFNYIFINNFIFIYYNLQKCQNM